jgi:hypothetical protein
MGGTPVRAASRPVGTSAARFAVATRGWIVCAALLAVFAPLRFSIATVFTFAGLHNWFEVRFFLSKMPPRWGRLRRFFYLALIGSFVLPLAFVALPLWNWGYGLSPVAWRWALGLWSTVLLLWVAALIQLRASERPGRDGRLAWPAALSVAAFAWLEPDLWSLTLVYLHPLLSLAFLYRIILRRRQQWKAAARAAMLLILLVLVLLFLWLHDRPSLDDRLELSFQITQHAGAEIIHGVSSHFLVAVHNLLETIHYGVWIAAVPSATRAVPWRTRTIPLSFRAPIWRKSVNGLMLFGVVAVITLWVCFGLNYSLTREIYFTVAILHVVAEAPFLLRAW